MRIIFLLLMSCCILSCQRFPQVMTLPLQHKTASVFKIEKLSSDNQVQQVSILTIQFEPQQWRWLQTDPLGAPLARMRLTPNGWYNDGFIMPNTQAKYLFSALSIALNPQTPLFNHPQAQMIGSSKQFYLKQKGLWQIEAKPPLYNIFLADGSHWQIEALE